MNLMSTLIYVPISFAYIIPMTIYMPHVITEEQLDIPKYKFGIMGSLDSLAGIMATFSVNFITNASIIVLIQQSAIPISMAVSKIALNAQYSVSQYTGAAIVLGGIFIVLIPTLTGHSGSSDDQVTTSSEVQHDFIVIIRRPRLTIHLQQGVGQIGTALARDPRSLVYTHVHKQRLQGVRTRCV